jgi:hypothetical protein
MAIPVIKVHSADGTVQTIDAGNPLSVTNVGAGGGVADVNVTDRAGRVLGDVDVTDRIGRLVGRMTNYDVLVNGTLGALNATVSLAGAGLGTVGVGISGTWAGTIVAEVEVGDGVWDPIPLIDNTLGSAALSTTVNGNFVLGVAGALTVRLRMSLYTSGTATVYLEGTSAASGVFLSRSIPTGGNLIGSILGAAGENHIGQVAGSGAMPSLALTNTLPAYVALDCVGGIQTVQAARVAGGHFILQAMTLSDSEGESEPYDVYIFSDSPAASTFTDADPAVLAAADRDVLVPGSPFRIYAGDYRALVGAESQAAKTNLGVAGVTAGGSQNVYVALVCVETPDYATTSALVATFDFLQD